MHKDIQAYLTSIGLTDTEIQTYIAGLREGPSSPQTLAKFTGISRTTLYSALGTLEQKGMTARSAEGGRTTFTMSPPETVGYKLTESIEDLERKRDDFGEILPLFDRILKQESTQTHVALHEGEQAVKTVIDMALFCASRKWKIIAPTQNYFTDVSPEYGEYHMKIRKQRGITTQALWERSFVAKRRFSKEDVQLRKPRLLSKSFEGKFKSIVILFDQKVAFINSHASGSAIIIESPEVHSMMEIFFDGLYTASALLPARCIKKENASTV